jgi:hypothetical protein
MLGNRVNERNTVTVASCTFSKFILLMFVFGAWGGVVVKALRS